MSAVPPKADIRPRRQFIRSINVIGAGNYEVAIHETAQSLFPLEFTDSTKYDEPWLQRLVHRQPSVLPIPSIEATFWPAVPVCMELPLRSGYLDNLLMTPAGDLIVIECKLWRNVEARR